MDPLFSFPCVFPTAERRNRSAPLFCALARAPAGWSSWTSPGCSVRGIFSSSAVGGGGQGRVQGQDVVVRSDLADARLSQCVFFITLCREAPITSQCHVGRLPLKSDCTVLLASTLFGFNTLVSLLKPDRLKGSYSTFGAWI